MLRQVGYAGDIPKPKKWQRIRCVHRRSLSLRASEQLLYQIDPHWGEKKATITQCGAAILWSLAGQSSHSQRPIKPIICRIICEIKTLATSNQAIVILSNVKSLGLRWHHLIAAQWCILLSKLHPESDNEHLMLLIQCLNSFLIYANVK